MVAATRTSVGAWPTSGASRWASLTEALLALVAVAAFLPQFERLSTEDSGRDRRFADVALSVGGLPDKVLPALCASQAGPAEPLVRDRLCRSSEVRSQVGTMPPLVADAFTQASRAFHRPVAEAERRRAELRLQQREGLGDLLELDDAIGAIDAELEPYVERYSLAGRDGAAPLPLACAFDMVKAALESPAERGEIAQANALLLLGAALDGHGATQPLSGAALLPAVRGAASADCGSLADALSAAAQIMTDARDVRIHDAKNAAMRSLLRSAGWQWAGWMLAGLVLLKLARRRNVSLAGLSLALAVWAVAAWIGQVPWPFGIDRAFDAATASESLWTIPPFVLALLGAAALALIAGAVLQRHIASGPQVLASRFGYPGLVVATGLGWVLLLDLSANGNFNNRYLALYHQGHLWLGMLTLTSVAFLRQPIGRALGWTLSTIGALATALHRGVGVIVTTAVVVVFTIGVVAAVGVLLTNVPQITSEIGRLWLIVGASWFFFLRGGPLLQRIARSGGSFGSLVRYVWPLAFVALVLVLLQLVTRDMGPLLIASYGAGAFVAASIAMWWHERSGAYAGAMVLAMALFVAWILGITAALFELGPFHEVTAGRLENLAAPFASANDQLALVTWFQRAAPPAGFGIGTVPWCGHAAALGCPGVPAQIQSDYTLTALVGVFGWTAAWAITIGCAIWLYQLLRRHGRATRGEPRLVPRAGRMVNDDQALLSWLVATWIVLTLCQLAVTVAGNLAVLPLTGVTFPFVSFGMTSLVVNMALLGLTINVDASSRAAHG